MAGPYKIIIYNDLEEAYKTEVKICREGHEQHIWPLVFQQLIIIEHLPGVTDKQFHWLRAIHP